jgi:hypothetical protein
LDDDHIVLLRGTYYGIFILKSYFILLFFCSDLVLFSLFYFIGPQNCGLTITKNLTFETYEDAGNVVLNCYGIKAPGLIIDQGKNVSLTRMTIRFVLTCLC